MFQRERDKDYGLKSDWVDTNLFIIYYELFWETRSRLMNTPARILLYINHIFIKPKEKKKMRSLFWISPVATFMVPYNQTIGAYNKELISI